MSTRSPHETGPRLKLYGVQDWVRLAVLFFAYLSTAKIGLMLDAINGFATLVWPPTGIALAALLLWGYRYWPAIAAGALLANYSTGAPFFTACGIALGNTLEAALGACLMRRAGFQKPLCKLREVLALIFLASILSTMVSASVGVLSLWRGGLAPLSTIGLTWRAWWIGDMLGNLVVAPLFLVLVVGHRPRLPSLKQILEVGSLALCLASVNWFIFWEVSATEIKNFPISYLIFPPLIWAALRSGPRGAAAATFLTSLLATWGTLWGHGPFAREIVSESLFSLQVFMGVVAVSTLILAAIVAERIQSEKRARESEEALRIARDQLEAKVQQRTEAQQRSLQELKTTQWQLVQAEKMETVGRLAASIAHEVKNPLSIITMGVQYLMGTSNSPPDKETAAGVLQDINRAVERADRVVKELMDFSSPQRLQRQPADLNDVIEQSLLMVKHPLAVSHVGVVRELGNPLPPLLLDKQKIEQALVNLFMNSIYAMPGSGTLTIRTYRQDGSVIAEVADTGGGIPPDKLSKIYDPFFTTKPTGKGTGLGLTVTRHILEMHDGTLSIQNRDGGSVVAVLTFKALQKGGVERCGRNGSY